VLRNVGPDNWVMMPEGESAIAVPSKRRLGVRTMVIDFGAVQGRISVDWALSISGRPLRPGSQNERTASDH
jgi:hypothetical protein